MKAKIFQFSRFTFQLILFFVLIISIPIVGFSIDEKQQAKKTPKEVDSSSETKEALTAKQMSQLEALGYLSGYVAPPLNLNVTIYDKEKAYDGLNFFWYHLINRVPTWLI